MARFLRAPVQEGTEITMAVPKSVFVPAGATVKFYDAGEHGFYSVNNGAATYVAYDPKTGLSYSAPAGTVPSTGSNLSFTATVPEGICGLIIQSAQEHPAPPKVLEVSLVGPDGKVLASGSFNLICDKYTLKVTIKASKDPVLPDGADQSTVTANLSVTGPAQYINGKKVKLTDPKIMLTTPLGLTMVHFDNSLGNIAPNPANVKTDLNGDASVVVSSVDAGIDKVQAIAQGIGDAIINVHFPPKITGVQEDFVQPNSPTNYQISTIPQNPKDLTFDWTIIRPAGLTCGSLTGAATGMLVKNGFFHARPKTFLTAATKNTKWPAK